LEAQMTSVAMLSMHTSPLAQPGEGDAGGMNVFVRELGAALAQAGVTVRVYVRRSAEDLEPLVSIEPGFQVIHVPVGPASVDKADLPSLVDAYADWVEADLQAVGGVDVLHANYWLSGVAGHRIKHSMSLPLVSTFHTLGRVKASSGDPEPAERVQAEASVIGCSDLITASNPIEAAQLRDLYGAPADRIELVPPGVDRAFFSPGDRAGARHALGLDDQPVMLFVGRLQPLKGVSIAVEALARLRRRDTRLLVVGGPSGADGADEAVRIHKLVADLGLADRVRFVAPQPHHLLSTYYRAADVCVVPSRSESFGLVALEAAACGTPVVAAAVGGLTTLVDDGVTGYLVPGRDPVDFADRIDAVLGDADLARSMSRAAAALVPRYNWATTAARLRRVYADLAERRVLVECGV
jgi:D-inositol-3-phosphate glycosyltransferase